MLKSRLRLLGRALDPGVENVYTWLRGDQDFSWNQIASALLQMSPRKAPGDDGISTAFYQATLYMPANTQEGVPPTPFARALLRVCGQIFASATIPRAWLCASIVSIDMAKCGIISFTGHLAPRLDNPLDIRLHGQLVSRVESYKYLGVLIDSKLDHSAWLKQKRSALEHTISALHPV
ncbi:hypothetical protein BASA61_008143, partial [Batrachochytrium salamandrivorans]